MIDDEVYSLKVMIITLEEILSLQISLLEKRQPFRQLQK